ncbi:MAG: hypothetical protein KF712_18950 [Akkermansiaceae bacterium]|nr:hypothetical protein [Akkermansiaceae bacterium]
MKIPPLPFLAIIIGLPGLQAQLVNPGFESTPLTSGWTSTEVTAQQPGLDGSANAARLPYNTTATLSQAFTARGDFTFDVQVAVAGTTTARSFRVLLDTGAGNAIELQGALGNAVQLNSGGQFHHVTSLAAGTTFTFPADRLMRFRIIGRGFGTLSANYDLVWSDHGSTTLKHAALNLTAFTNAAAAGASGISVIRFDRPDKAAHSYWVDNVSITTTAEAPPAATHQLVLPPPPEPPKIVNISGVYPHLAVTNSENECGIGAVVPWQGDLWAVTYAPHRPDGSNDKLYQISPALSLGIRPESIGGTPANRFIHTASNQLIIGPHFIDAAKTVRTIPYSRAPGRITATAAHLSDPNRVYMFTMEDGLYDVDTRDLSVITRYPDRQSGGDDFLFGYHGKGAYTGGGRFIAANNGRHDYSSDPAQESGVLASWDGSVRGTADTNPEWMTAWTEHYRVQTCEVTGPGGIYGNSSSSDPVWTTGFDANSVILRTFEDGIWHTWRLPKGSRTHDGAHGWHTEWPRIREVLPGHLLMHMHGMFYDFPKTFSSANFSGLSPICSHYKMPVDYCTWEGRLVMAKNDTSKFSNDLVPRAQSNFWFGQLSDLRKWGAPQGHGTLWRTATVAPGQSSDPFLVAGFLNGTLHVRNTGTAMLPLDLMTSDGVGGWQRWKSITVPSGGYLHELLENMPGTWLKLTSSSGAAVTGITATIFLSNPHPHVTPASAGTDEFAALADIRDTGASSDGLIRVMSGTDLKLEFASRHQPASGPATTGYHQIGGGMQLQPVAAPATESAMRTAAATTKEFGSDAASAWVTVSASNTAKLRLPKTDPRYDTEFLSGWARGFREAVTERVLLNCHGTFYEVPRDNSGGRRKLQPISTHGKRITDFASWRGLLVLTGVLDSAPESDSLVKSADGSALWLGEIDDIWRMGEPRGTGGPWLDTTVTANAPSDAYLMYGYRSKSLDLAHRSPSPVTFTVEVDFLADNTWSTYGTFTVQPGQTFTHAFPDAFQAHWVRVKAGTATTVTAQFTYGPAAVRDRFLDWARDAGLATGAGRSAVAADDSDHDGHPAILEYLLGTDPTGNAPLPLAAHHGRFETILRSGSADDRLGCTLEISDTLENWTPRPDLLQPSADQSGVASGFIRMQAEVPSGWNKCFFRLRAGFAATP